MKHGMRCRIILIFFFIGNCLGCIFSQSAQWLAEIQKKEAFRNASLGIFVKNISTGEEIITHNHDQYFIPASTLKIKTSIDALRQFGADHRFETKVYIDGHVDQGVLYGDIIIEGGGDPTFGGPLPSSVSVDAVVSDIQMYLREENISCIMGQIVADASFFGLPGIPTGYFFDDIANYYGAGVYGLNISDNQFPVVFQRQNEGRVDVKSFDSLAIDFIEHDVMAKGRSDQAYAFPHPTSGGMFVKGTIPEGRGDFRIRAAIPNPPSYIAKYVHRALQAQGIELQSEPITRWKSVTNNTPDIRWQKKYVSPPIGDMLIPILHKSNNMYAEALFRHCKKSGSEKVDDRIIDGSGLSSTNRVQPVTMMACLEQGVRDFRVEFVESLPKNGREGTVKSVLRNDPGKLLVKSGYINFVRSYVGLHKAKNGDWIGFVCFANNLESTPTASRRAWETFLQHIAKL